MWYDNEVTQGILKKKYLHEGEETFEDLVNRVSSIYSKDIRDDVKNAMMNADLSPAGRTLYAAGTKGKKRLTLSNCFIIGNISEDTLESISQADYEIARIGALGGGCGFAVDNIRPKGTKINNSARISDGVAFAMRKINQTGQIVGQFSRNLALMCGIDCKHPDIVEFLHLKENEEKLASMNISIKFTDDFMDAVINNKEYELYFKVEPTGEEVRRKINAREFFIEFCEVNRDYGDPGCIFIDRVRNYNLVSGYPDYQIDICNPCVTGDTLILTDNGYKRIDSLVGKEVNVWNGYQFSKVTPKITGYNQKMKRITMSNGISLDCTHYHKFVLANGSRVEAQNLKIGDKLKKWEYPVIEGKKELTNAYTKGFYSGDGTKGKAEIALYGQKQKLIDRLAHRGFTVNSDTRTLVRLVQDDTFVKDFVPDTTYTIKSRLEWLAGLIDSDGNLNAAGGALAINSVDFDFLNRVYLMLGTLGVFSNISVCHKEADRMLPVNDGTGKYKLYHCKTSYRLQISSINTKRLVDLGMVLYRVKLPSELNPNRNASRYICVKTIEDIPDADIVYCFNEPINHTGIFNGIMTAQCAEYFGNDGNSCLLQSINLYNIVNNKFEDNAEIDYEKFEHLIRLSIKMMNQTQDYGYDMLPLDKNRKNVDDWRSIGLGTFGMADMLVAMKLKYGSKESIELVSTLFDFMSFIALDESCNEAKKHGTFGKYDWNKQKESPIIKALRLTREGCELYDKIEKYGLRNSSLLSIAPNGSISLFMGKLSGGCEPLFKLWYDRTTHAGEDKGVVFRVFSRSVEDLFKYNNIDDMLTIEQAKNRFPWLVESADISPHDRIKMQSVMQEYVDNAISSTINLPEGTSSDTIFDIYIEAWKQKLKGITVFVDNCKRGNILGVNKKEETPSFKYDSIEPVKRRGVKEVSGKTFRMQTACSRLYITVNYTDEGDLFEVFTNITGGCTSNINSLCRLTSAALRSGMKVSSIIDELRSVSCPACQALRRKGEKDIELSCGNAIANALEKAYKDSGRTIETKKDEAGLYECPQCHQKTLRLEAKCCVCSNPDCNYSKCE